MNIFECANITIQSWIAASRNNIWYSFISFRRISLQYWIVISISRNISWLKLNNIEIVLTPVYISHIEFAHEIRWFKFEALSCVQTRNTEWSSYKIWKIFSGMFWWIFLLSKNREDFILFDELWSNNVEFSKLWIIMGWLELCTLSIFCSDFFNIRWNLIKEELVIFLDVRCFFGWVVAEKPRVRYGFTA